MDDMNAAVALADHAKVTVLRDAESRMADGADPKVVVVDALLDYVAESKAFDLAPKLADPVNTQIMIFGPDHAQIVGAIKEAEAQFSGIEDAAAMALLAWTGDDLDLPTTTKNFIRAVLKAPMPMNRGKWLAKFGIVKGDLDAITPSTTTAAPPAPPAPEAPAEFDMNAMLGLTGDAQAAPPPPTVAPAGAGTPETGEVSSVHLRDAFVAFGEALDSKDADVAKRLGISRSTLHNMVSGKTQRVKCSLDQARVMLGEIDVRMSKLMAAADVFRQVR